MDDDDDDDDTNSSLSSVSKSGNITQRQLRDLAEKNLNGRYAHFQNHD
jgi:hypothetical protein